MRNRNVNFFQKITDRLNHKNKTDYYEHTRPNIPVY